jgi:hypothetical protein
MPGPLVTAGASQNGAGARRGSGGNAQQVLPVVPFVRASSEHREPAGIDFTRTLSAGGTQNPGGLEIPAYGYVRSLVLLVTATGAVAGTLAENGPWTVIQDIALTEPNGAILSQFTDGFELMLANKYGGYRDSIGADPRQSPAYSQDAAGNFSFLLRIPVELNLRDALGSLPNQTSAATFKLRVNLASGAAGAGLYSAAPTTQPNVRVVGYLEAWDQPEVSSGGQTNQVTPPAMNTTQFWSTTILPVAAGANTLRLPRVGNHIRNLIFMFTRTAGTRVNGDTDFPDPFTLLLDTRPLDIVNKTVWRNQMYERSGYGGRAAGGALTAALANDSAGGLDNGVFVYDFMHEFDGTYGREMRDLWLPTLGSTRLEIQGTFANAGQLRVMTNDVAVAGSVFV